MTNILYPSQIRRDDSSSITDTESDISEIDLEYRSQERLATRGALLLAIERAFHAIAKSISLGPSSPVSTFKVANARPVDLVASSLVSTSGDAVRSVNLGISSSVTTHEVAIATPVKLGSSSVDISEVPLVGSVNSGASTSASICDVLIARSVNLGASPSFSTFKEVSIDRSIDLGASSSDSTSEVPVAGSVKLGALSSLVTSEVAIASSVNLGASSLISTSEAVIASSVNMGASSSISASEVSIARLTDLGASSSFRDEVQQQDCLLGEKGITDNSTMLRFNQPPRLGVSFSVAKITSSTSEATKEVQNQYHPSGERNKSNILLNDQLLCHRSHPLDAAVAAGWPSWLIYFAGEAIIGWTPRQPDTYEKILKIGQGKRSHVYKGRDVLTGKYVTLKKVIYDTSKPESMRVIAREILFMRRLNHPNVMKLEGLVTSKMSRSLYLVFEYMEHDLARLNANPEIKFTEPQVKSYMYQLLLGLEHCHERRVLHRDIKGSNLLDNEGVLKIAGFGLASFLDTQQKHPMTSRAVSLRYRPPELLFGATNYGVAVDLWSAGCILFELIARKPFMTGRTEVEQLHMIFKLCGSPSEGYWESLKLPHASIFKPQQPYERRISETFSSPFLSSLIETLLAIEPSERRTATDALRSGFYDMKPYRCQSSSLAQYPHSITMKAEEYKRRSAAIRKAFDVHRRRTRRGQAIKVVPIPTSNVVPQANYEVLRETDPIRSSSEKFPRLPHYGPFTWDIPNQLLAHKERPRLAYSGRALLPFPPTKLCPAAKPVSAGCLPAKEVSIPEADVELQSNLEESHLTKHSSIELPHSHQGGLLAVPLGSAHIDPLVALDNTHYSKDTEKTGSTSIFSAPLMDKVAIGYSDISSVKGNTCQKLL